MTIFLIVLAYLLVGYGWAMLFIHKLTDGRWEEISILGDTYYTPMGVTTLAQQTRSTESTCD